MLTHPSLERLSSLGLHGMAKAFSELVGDADAEAMTHGEWLGLLLEREASLRHDKRLGARLHAARLRHSAAPEDIDWKAARGLDKALGQKLLKGEWIKQGEALIITGPTGVGKSWLACAIGHQACRNNTSVLYTRIPKLFADLAEAEAEGRYLRRMRALGRVQLLILDDWGLEPLDARQRHDLMEILEERYGRGAILLTSQLPVDRWHDIIGDPTYADAILDRLVHHAHRIALSGESLRRFKRSKSQLADPT